MGNKKKKIKIKLTAEQLHRELQNKSRKQRNKKKYSRKGKYKDDKSF